MKRNSILRPELTENMNRVVLMLTLLLSFVVGVQAEQGRVSITFDDGYKSAYLASMILDKAGIKATYFIVTHFVDQPGYMTRGEVKKLAAEGHEIGSHTRNHPHLRRLTLVQQKSEIDGSLKDFSAWGLHPTSFAYPYGEYNNATFIALGRAGFKAARTVDKDENNKIPYLLSGYVISSKTTLEDIEIAVRDAQKKGKWLILVFHRVDESFDNPINTTHEVVQGLVDYLVQNKIEVVTIASVLN